MLHVVPMFFYNWLHKPGRSNRNNDHNKKNDDVSSMEDLMESAAQQLRDLDARQQQYYYEYPSLFLGSDNQQDASAVAAAMEKSMNEIYPIKPSSSSSSSPRQYEPMQKVPFVSLEINLDDTERSEDDDEEEVEEPLVLDRERYFLEPAISHHVPFARTTSAAIQSSCDNSQEKSPSMRIVHSNSSLILDRLSANKELSASKAVVDLVARVTDSPESTKMTLGLHTASSPGGSPVSGAPGPAILHRTPIPSEIVCQTLDHSNHSSNIVMDESESSSDTLCSEEIMDPTDALIYGWIENDYLQNVAEQMNDCLVAAEDDDLTSLCRATTALMHQHPMSCQVKYRPPEFDSLCYPLSYFSAAGWLEGCQAAYAAFPEAIGQENDNNKIGLPLHYACLHQASPAVVRYLVETYPEAARVTNARHQTPLHCACRSADCQLEVVELLVQHYPTAAQLADLEGYTPFHLACKFGASLAVLAALQASSPTVIRGVTLKWHRPLHVALVHAANLSTVQWLVQKDPSALRSTTEDFSTVLHCAVAGACADDVIRFLRDAHPAALGLTNEDDETPYHVGLRCGMSTQMLQLLIPPREER